MASVADPGSRVVRVFISSTFRDFEQERNLLAKEVFPELRRRARERFVEVMEVDLRWGITQEQSEQGLTLPICLREIERARPYFIGLLGERYGWTPTPGQYSELLLDQHAWLKEHMGGTSVTELEILHGVLRDPAMAGRAYFYFRDPAYSADKGPDFRSEGAIERAKLDELKSKIRSSGFPVVEYATPHAVAQRIIDDLWSRIDEQYPADEVPDELERERRSHESYAAERRRVFVGQEATVAALLGRLESADAASHLTVVTGESGTGKSALLANVLEQYRAKHPHDQVIEHYLAAGYGAADPAKILRRLAAEIKRFTGTLKEIEQSDDLLMQQLAEWLAEASAWAQQAGRSVIIALNGLDKLNGSRSLAWLPRQLPPHVRVVVSKIELGILGADHAVQAVPIEISVQAATPIAASAFLEHVLNSRGKHLPAREIERIIAHPRATLPIFLKTLVDELSVYGSFEGLPGRISQCLAAAEPDDLFEVILARLEDDMGRDSVQKPLEAIWAAPGGLSDAELVGFAGVTPLELARLKLALGDALHEDRGMVMPAHDYLRKGIKDRYLESDELVSELHHRLGAWWELQEPSNRMGWAVNWHHSLARNWSALERCLIDARIGAAILHGVTTQDVFCSWNSITNAGAEQAIGTRIERALTPTWAQWKNSSNGHEAVVSTAHRLLCVTRLAGALSLSVSIASHLLALARFESERQSTIDTKRDAADMLDVLAVLHLELDEVDLAESEHLECLRQRRSIFSKTNSDIDCRALSMSLDNVARFRERRGDLRGALSLYEESRNHRQALHLKTKTLDARRDLSLSFDSLGRIHEETGQLTEARTAYHESFQLRCFIPQWFGDDADFRDIFVSLNNEARIALRCGNLDSAIEGFQSCLILAQHRHARYPTPESRADLGLALQNAGYGFFQRGDLDSVAQYYNSSLDLRRSLATEFGNFDSVRDVAYALHNIAQIEAARGHTDLALEHLTECIMLQRSLVAKRSYPEDWRDLGQSLFEAAQCEFNRGTYSAAAALLSESQSISSKLSTAHRTPRDLNDYARNLFALAAVELRLEHLNAALAKYEESLRIARELASTLNTPQSQRDLELSLNQVVWTTQLLAERDLAADNAASALARLDSVLPLAEELQQSTDANALDTVAVAWERRGEVLDALNQSSQAAECRARAKAIRERIASLNPPA